MMVVQRPATAKFELLTLENARKQYQEFKASKFKLSSPRQEKKFEEDLVGDEDSSDSSKAGSARSAKQRPEEPASPSRRRTQTDWFSGDRRKPAAKPVSARGRYGQLLQDKLEIQDQNQQKNRRGRKLSQAVGYRKCDVVEAFADPKAVLNTFRSVKTRDERARNHINTAFLKVCHPEELVERARREEFVFDLRI